MMQMNPSFGANMYNPQMSMSSGGDDMMIIFILVIICSCCMFCVFIYYYVKKSKKDKDKDCLIHSDETTCVADTSCSWDSSLYLCVKSVGSDSQKPHCSVSKRVLNKECVSCPKFDENDPRSPLRAKSSAPAPKDGPDTSCTVLQPCPADYHVVNGSCVKCPTGKVNNAASGPPSSNTQCKRPLCSNSQRIVCEVEGTLGTCGERCCCEDCISGYESSSVHVQSPDDATESDVICVPEGEGASREVSRVPSSQPLKALCPLGYSVDENHNCTPCSAGRTTYTQHNPNGPSTQCDKAECSKGQRSDPSYGGGEGYCRSCLGQETNPGGFRPNDEVYSSCLYCKPNSYIDNGECVKCPGDKENFEAQEKMFLKTDTSMIGEHKCKSKLCSPTEFINCVRDATDSDTWTCSCDPCSSYLTTGPTELTEATSIHTEYLEDVQSWLGSTAEPGIVAHQTECVADCEGAFYISKIDEARALISKCDSSLSSCGVDELKTMKDDLDSLVVKCDSDDKASKMNTIQLAIDDIETLLSQKPCLKNERKTLDAPYCTPCDYTNEIGSYPSSRTIDFSNEHEHTVPRAAALVETECKKPLCSPSQRLTADGCSSDCPAAAALGAPEYSPSGGCSHDGKIDGTKDASCIPGNGMHYVSPTDATENDYTECRDPTAVVATCGNIDGSGTTVSVANCGSGYTPVTGAGLQTECGGTACDITPGNANADHKKCCVENETCAGRILYEGIVGNVTDGGVITLDIPGETSSLSSSGIIGKKIRFTISSDPPENLIGTIENYEYLNDGDHKISVTYDDDGSESTSVITNKTFIILEELSSSCGPGKISNNNPDIHCIGSSCDFAGLTDPDKCCVALGDGYIVSPNQTCDFVGADGETITLEHVLWDADLSSTVALEDGKQKCKEAVEWLQANKPGPIPATVNMASGQPFLHSVSPAADTNSPPGCWWWDPTMSTHGFRNRVYYNTREELGSNHNTAHNYKRAICTGVLTDIEAAEEDPSIEVTWSSTGSNETWGATDSAGPGTGPWNTGLHDGTFTSIRECEQACDDDTNCDSFSVHPNGLHGGVTRSGTALDYVICNGHPVGAVPKSTSSNPWRCYKKTSSSTS